jgi:hypothetical protein
MTNAEFEALVHKLEGEAPRNQWHNHRCTGHWKQCAFSDREARDHARFDPHSFGYKYASLG